MWNLHFAPLFRPLRIGRTLLANRIVMAPMTRGKSPGGIPGADVATYYRRRAEGGVGLIITEGTYIDHPTAPNSMLGVPVFHGHEALTGWQRVVDEVHAADGRIAAQLWHTGPARRPVSGSVGVLPGFGPSEIVENGQIVTKAMSLADIAEITQAYARSAHTAEQTGFDAIELHGAHGYLLDAFLWSGSNQRQDIYGGTLENRVRFATEVVRAVRAAVAKDFPVIYRFSQWKVGNYTARIANDAQELRRILEPLIEAGVDVFHASTRRFWEPEFAGSPETLASWTRRITGKPTIAVGSIGLDKAFTPEEFRGAGDPTARSANLDQAVSDIANGKFDLIAVGRALLADPEWANKLRDGRIGELKTFTAMAASELVI
jgi:2,4-dienoyl-CoA reductase-like NADH-dependent reductase (Old Yellow Enzyme family)